MTPTGCSPNSTGSVAPTDSDAAQTSAAIEAAQGDAGWLSARGEGGDRAEAEANARRELTVQLLGDAGWLSLYPLEIHDAARDPGPVVGHGVGRVSVVLGLSRARAAAVVSQLETIRPVLVGPAGWRETLYAFVTAHASAHACARRQALFQARCEAGDLAESEAELRALATSVRVVAEYTDGVPVDANGNVLRMPGVFVLWNGVPAAGVPVRVTAPATGSEQSVSGPAGRVEVALAPGATMPAQLQVTVDAPALLGPLAPAWPDSTLRLVPRPVSLSRWGLVVRNASSGGGDTQALGRTLKASGLSAPQPVPSAEGVAAAGGGRRATAVAAAARQARGALDYVIVAELDSAFSSRMGGARVWFQASGSLELLDAWTGASVARVQATVRASGVGDEGADAAARAKLVAALATALRTDSPIPWPRP